METCTCHHKRPRSEASSDREASIGAVHPSPDSFASPARRDGGNEKPVESKAAAQAGAHKRVDSVTTLKSSSASNPSGSEDEENSLLQQGKHDETRCKPQSGEDGSIVSHIAIEGDLSLRVSEIINCFKKAAGLRLRGSTPYTYERIFRLYASDAQIEKLTKRQLAGSKGKETLLAYLLDEKKVSLASRRLYNAALKTVWEGGLGLTYPVNSRRDLGEMPPVQRRQSPRDNDLIPLVKAIDHEAEPYLKALVLIILQTGIRPSHARLFRWHHV